MLNLALNLSKSSIRARWLVGLLVLLFAGLFLPPALAEETCGDDPADSPNHSANYILGSDATDGMAMHWVSGLVWQRCAEGQTWDGSTCNGTATEKPWNDWMVDYMPKPFADLGNWWTPVFGYTPPAMPNLTTVPNRLLTGDWRMSYEEELDQLTTSCANSPKINRHVFPNTPSSYFWSGSPYAGQSGFASSVYFVDGFVNGHYLLSATSHFGFAQQPDRGHAG